MKNSKEQEIQHQLRYQLRKATRKAFPLAVNDVERQRVVDGHVARMKEIMAESPGKRLEAVKEIRNG